MGFIQYKLTDRCRKRLLRLFPPRFAIVKCDHVTAEFGVPQPDTPPPLPKKLYVVGYATDDIGLECLVVSANATTRRSDGKILHITLSVAEGRRSVESNDVLSTKKWRRLRKKVPLNASYHFEP